MDISIWTYRNGHIGNDDVRGIGNIDFRYIPISDISRPIYPFLAMDISEMDISEMTSSNVSIFDMSISDIPDFR